MQVGRMVTSLILLIETLKLSSSLASIIEESKASSDLLVAVKEACGCEPIRRIAQMIEELIDKETLQGEREECEARGRSGLSTNHKASLYFQL